jgi:uncharacterized protein GlcG (DUF336 family)
MSSEFSFQQRSVSLAIAGRILDAAVAYAGETDRAMVVAVVDQGGVLKAFGRMDGAPLLSVQIAQDKAYSAAAFGMPTDQWYEFIKDDGPLLHGIVHTPRLTIFGGGFPILDEGQVVGGVGVSGGHYRDDMEVAKAALDRVGLGGA